MPLNDSQQAPLRPMAKAPLSEGPLAGPLASRRPATQISMVEPRLMPATWCQVPSKTLLVEVTLPPAPASKEQMAFVELAVPRPSCWLGPAVGLVKPVPLFRHLGLPAH